MGESIYFAFAVSVVRSLLLVAGGWLVSRGLAEDNTLMREVATGLALIVVTQGWMFWRIHRRALYQRWLVALGLDSPADTDPATIDQAARDAVRRGLQP